jgi:hypothetical protein
MLRHPRQGVERVRGRIDRGRDRRELEEYGAPASVIYGDVSDWAQQMHTALGQPWPCAAKTPFLKLWEEMTLELEGAGVRVGMFSYGRWNDCDRAFAEAIWCIIAHVQPLIVVETGVAHGLTSRIVLEGLARNDRGNLWSVDLPAVDPALHAQIGMAVPKRLRSRWTYVAGTSHQRLPGVVAETGDIDLFIHDSLHTGRNQYFELEATWSHMRPGGLAVVDDIDHSLGFHKFLDWGAPASQLAARHVTGPGLWGVAMKAGGASDFKKHLEAPQTSNVSASSCHERWADG